MAENRHTTPTHEQTVAEALWTLLDDIDTADDMFKDNHEGYRNFVRERAARRFRYIESDGYSLTWRPCVEA